MKFLIPILLVFTSIVINFCSTIGSQDAKNAKSYSGEAPPFIEGLYINTKTIRDKKFWNVLFAAMQESGMNAAVLDIQPVAPTKEQVDDLKSRGIYPIARVVNFEGGLIEKSPPPNLMLSIQKAIRTACLAGFKEIQLDYIRYADGGTNFSMSYEKRYDSILSIISDHKEKTKDVCGSDVTWSADIFGRVPFIENDVIGQKVEPFSEKLDGLYPMLYPSHFYGLTKRVADPYGTIKDGLDFTVERAKPGTRAIAWVQGFKMMIGPSRLSYQDYIKVQMLGAKDSKGNGFIVWNAGNDYADTLEAFEEYKKEKDLDRSKPLAP
ncbi:putative glycoside hydrolase [Leptospira ilyithenensis]|uniref:Glycosyl hydrolase n=1 Tax=Leptospira ilyithenensis TaxID=2484901 RepID=A0A4R9LJP0_9LEPT|nr:putative glycoside hydrolase [Leptospira ilyithenensis]TGN07053.1 glycosyl hydrolase [Leptospira ilyithenensis]